jgi:hypothetical protein
LSGRNTDQTLAQFSTLRGGLNAKLICQSMEEMPHA